jgi:hypothetical protein
MARTRDEGNGAVIVWDNTQTLYVAGTLTKDRWRTLEMIDEALLSFAEESGGLAPIGR